jgi:hypothetical protein
VATEEDERRGTELPRIGAPAGRALQAAGYQHLEDVAGRPAAELLALHGIGERALVLLDEALGAADLPLLGRDATG